MHTPVLQKEVLEYLAPKLNENFIDCTINGGGHSLEILKTVKPAGKILGIDWDKSVVESLKLKVQNLEINKRIILVCDSYTNLKTIVESHNFRPVKGILLDLGMSSWHLEESKKGFSFQKDEMLDMRYSKDNQLTAEKIINEYSEEQIGKILKEYGEERFAKKIAKIITDERKIKPIRTTLQLVEIIKKAIPVRFNRGRIHFATRTFQALRIAVNDELNNLKKVLPQAKDVLAENGRMVVISFHSLEDRIVKNFFRENKQNFEILTKKPITAKEEEINANPRARSAKLRAAQKIR